MLSATPGCSRSSPRLHCSGAPSLRGARRAFPRPLVPLRFPAGTGFVEDAGCVHILVNEDDVDLEVVVMQIVPKGAPRRIDEQAP